MAMQNVAERADAQVISFPIMHIKDIFTMGQAMHICDHENIRHEQLNVDTAVVLWVEAHDPHDAVEGPDEEEHPDEDEIMFRVCQNVEKLHVFCVAPRTRLRQRIMECKDYIMDSKSKQGGDGQKRMDQVALVDSGELLHRQSFGFEFEISFRGDLSAKKKETEAGVRSVILQTDTCDFADMGGACEDLKDELMPSDFSRAIFALQDAIALRRGTVDLGAKFFETGLTEWVNDWSSLATPLDESLNVQDTIAEASAVYRSLETNKDHDANLYYQEASTRAVVSAVRHMLEVEKEFQILAKKEKEGPDENSASEDEDWSAKKGTRDGEDAANRHHARWRCSNCKHDANDIHTHKECEVCGHPQPPQRHNGFLDQGHHQTAMELLANIRAGFSSEAPPESTQATDGEGNASGRVSGQDILLASIRGGFSAETQPESTQATDGEGNASGSVSGQDIQISLSDKGGDSDSDIVPEVDGDAVPELGGRRASDRDILQPTLGGGMKGDDDKPRETCSATCKQM
jgi:rubrerythrin